MRFLSSLKLAFEIIWLFQITKYLIGPSKISDKFSSSFYIGALIGATRDLNGDKLNIKVLLKVGEFPPSEIILRFSWGIGVSLNLWSAGNISVRAGKRFHFLCNFPLKNAYFLLKNRHGSFYFVRSFQKHCSIIPPLFF